MTTASRTTSAQTAERYALGHDDPELVRLDDQGAMLGEMTRLALRFAGLRDGCSVIDMGTGTGQVAQAVAELVGASGSVTGVDTSAAAIDYARRSATCAGLETVRFITGDVATYRPEVPVDAVVSRLLLPYQADRVAVIRHWLECVREGGVVMAMEYDLAASRTIPSTPTADLTRERVLAAFAAVGQAQSVGPRLKLLLQSAGVADPHIVGLQGYFDPDDPTAGRAWQGVTRSLLPVMEKHGIATAEEVDVDTLHTRIAAEVQEADAIGCPPILVAAWGTRGS